MPLALFFLQYRPFRYVVLSIAALGLDGDFR